MKKQLSLSAAILAGALAFAPISNLAFAQDTAPAGTYAEDDAHAYIYFTYDHQGYSAPYLRFNDFAVEVNYDPANVTASTVNVTIDAASIDSGVADFDDHLNSADFFETETYPEITFVSTGLTQATETTGTLTGDLTIKGITKPVTLDVTLNKIGTTMQGDTPKMGFSAKGTVLRSDFDVDAYVPYVSDEVDLIIEIELEKSE
ncbi:polyisoprenoid-binding protein [Parvularcula flava]|uniref:Polyisoprenoid-binding protein n=1 Tax=Aquisalinus luteolus TaxID=1566827 RepID=A0A8J3A0N2_9PROT|nr:YceI family protein [Aquisalinus luteolus]NHK26897.1 polyisoprenoid-binding protein [Aquisalinus luteolus]GGH93746.1 polyisoprenoid-binding protein [Aquisalinus luteolus]